MPTRSFSAVVLAASVGCSRLPIEDGRKIGPLVQVKDSFTSCYMLEFEPGRVAFFDACFDSDGGAVENALDEEGLSLDAVEAVFLSHGHTDHISGLRALPQANVYALAAEQSLLREGGQPLNVALRDGDEVALGDYRVRVFSVTGHTDGSAVYEVDGVLLMGDTVIAQKDGSLAPPAVRYSDDPTENDESVRELVGTLDALDLDIKWVAPAHSGPVQGMKALRAF